MVGAAGFEPTTLCPPDKCATRLRYTPTRGMPYRTQASHASADFERIQVTLLRVRNSGFSYRRSWITVSSV